MPQQLFLLAIVAMVGLAALRVIRVQLGRAPLPQGRARTLFKIAFLVVPPIVLGALIQPVVPGGSPLSAIVWVPLYGLILAGLAGLMALAAVVVEVVARGRPRRLLLLALAGSEGDPEDLPYDPPVTAKLLERMALVDRTNAAFPRGLVFPTQVDRAGFSQDWDALDAATRALEDQISEDRRLGLGVASAATVTATDARNRLDTLRGIANSHGLAAAV